MAFTDEGTRCGSCGAVFHSGCLRDALCASCHNPLSSSTVVLADSAPPGCRWLWVWLLSACGAAIHLAAVIAPFLAAGGIGEAVGWRLMILDLPVSMLLDATGATAYLTTGTATLIYTMLGSIVYAAPGAFIGYFVDRRRARRHHSPNHSRQATAAPARRRAPLVI